MAVRSTTARRLATVIVATAAVSALGSGAASAASTDSTPTTTTTTQVEVPPLSLPQVSVLLHNLLGTVDGLLGDSLGVRTPEEIEADKGEPVLSKTVDNLTKTTKSLPLLGGAVGGLTDDLGLSEPTRVAEVPTAPKPAAPSPAGPAKDAGRTDRVDQAAPVGSTWTMPMEEAPVAPAATTRTDNPSPSGLPGFLDDIRGFLPSSAAGAAAAGAGAATVALIVLGGIAVTGAAGAASAAGRRGLINGSVGGSL